MSWVNANNKYDSGKESSNDNKPKNIKHLKNGLKAYLVCFQTVKVFILSLIKTQQIANLRIPPLTVHCRHRKKLRFTFFVTCSQLVGRSRDKATVYPSKVSKELRLATAADHNHMSVLLAPNSAVHLLTSMTANKINFFQLSFSQRDYEE